MSQVLIIHSCLIPLSVSRWRTAKHELDNVQAEAAKRCLKSEVSRTKLDEVNQDH